MEIKNLEKKQMTVYQKADTKIHIHDVNNVSKVIADNASSFIDKESKINVDNARSASIKSNIKDIGMSAVTSQVEGGKEIQQALFIADEFSIPVKYTTEKGKQLAKKGMMLRKKNKLKKVDLKKKMAKKHVKNNSKRVVKKVTKDTTKAVAKKAAKVTAKATATIAGTATTGPFGFLIGVGAGIVTDKKIEQIDRKRTSRNRKIKFFLDKTKAQDKQQDSLQSLLKDIIINRIKAPTKSLIVGGIAILLLALLSLIVTFPQIAVIATIYSSPFAIFLPPLEDGDSVMTVTSAYVAEFNRDINTIEKEHKDCDRGEIVYVDYEGDMSVPSNYFDIMSVYMVKHGIGDTASIMNDASKENLKSVVNDMCLYTTETKKETITANDGTTSEKSVLYVNVTLKTYKDMIQEYDFNTDEIEILEEMMSSENLAMLGYSENETLNSGVTQKSSMTQKEIDEIVKNITDPVKKQVVSFALSKVGYPYSQAYRDSGNYYDCSSLAYYSWKSAGVDISYGGATTAASEGEGLEKAGKSVSYDKMQPGDLIFFSYCKNGRYKNISHVAVYAGNGKIVEARSTKYGVIYRNVPNIGCIVFIARPQ